MDTYKKYDEREKNIWTEECESLLAEWSEKASCYRWLHGRSEKKYQRTYYCFSIPVIILSTLTGAANVGMDSFVPAESKSLASAIVGSVNIFAGIISTLQNFLKVAELMEAHRIAGVSWGKLQRNIAIELALDPSRRVLQSDFLKLSRAEYDRLIEAGPIIDDSIIYQFNNKFKNYEVSKPSICNGLDKCNIYKCHVYKKEGIIDEKYTKDDYTDGIEDVITDEEKITSVDKLLEEEKQVIVNIKDNLDDNLNDDNLNDILNDNNKKCECNKEIDTDTTSDSTETKEELKNFLDGIEEVEKK